MKKSAAKERIVLGVDPGTNITGYGIVTLTGQQIRVLTCGVIDMSRSDGGHPDKLKRIFERVLSLIAEFHPDELAIEAPFFGKNVQSMLKLGRAQGVAMAAALYRDIPIFEYAPLKVKKAVTGNGRASKEQVSKMLETIVNFSDKRLPLDATDGLAVAVCHCLQNGTGDSKSSSWKSFLRENPGRIRKRGNP